VVGRSAGRRALRRSPHEPTGTSQSSLWNEYDRDSTRTRDRRQPELVGWSSRRPSSRLDGVARASGTTSTRHRRGAPASRGRGLRHRECRGVEALELRDSSCRHDGITRVGRRDVAHAVVAVPGRLAGLGCRVYGAPKRSIERPTSSSTSGSRRSPASGQDAGVRPVALLHEDPRHDGSSTRRRDTSAGRSRPPPRGGPHWRRRRSPSRPRAGGRTPAAAPRRDARGWGPSVRTAVDHQHVEVVVVLLPMETQLYLEPGPGLRVTTTATTAGTGRRTSSASSRPRPRWEAVRREAVDHRCGPTRPRGHRDGSSGGSSALMKDDSVPSPSRSLRTPAGQRRVDRRVGRYAHAMITALAGGVGAARFCAVVHAT